MTLASLISMNMYDSSDDHQICIIPIDFTLEKKDNIYCDLFLKIKILFEIIHHKNAIDRIMFKCRTSERSRSARSNRACEDSRTYQEKRSGKQ